MHLCDELPKDSLKAKKLAVSGALQHSSSSSPLSCVRALKSFIYLMSNTHHWYKENIVLDTVSLNVERLLILLDLKVILLGSVYNRTVAQPL